MFLSTSFQQGYTTSQAERFTPCSGTSVAPSSNNSHCSVLSQPSLPPAQPLAHHVGGRQHRKLLANRPRSFDAGTARQIKIAAGGGGGPSRRNNKARIVGGGGAGSASKRGAGRSGAMAAAAAAAHKSPRKNVQLARRNLSFDKSPRFQIFFFPQHWHGVRVQ